MDSKPRLPVLDNAASFESPVGSLDKEGRRVLPIPADVTGRFTTLRHSIYAALIGVILIVPFIQIKGHPALFLDIPHRRFYLFGETFNAQDFWLSFFLLTGIGFLLILTTTLLGRVWCGYACPQTVWLEGVYRRIERFIEGSRSQRMRRQKSGMTRQIAVRAALKHAAFAVVSVFLAHVFLSYFVSLPSLTSMVQQSPAKHPEAFAWMAGFGLVLYLNFGWFREQLCLIVCPYGRLQSALTDSHTLTIGYDVRRGEPRSGGRGSSRRDRASDKHSSSGDCIDCRRCVHVCPTGIDIRNGLQLECIGCAACIDACDAVMTKIGRPKGLVRYDAQAGFDSGEKVRWFRPRIGLYALLGLVGLTVAAFAFRSHQDFEANLMRLKGAPYTVEHGASGVSIVRNGYEMHLVNKGAEPAVFQIKPHANSAASTATKLTISRPELEIPPLTDARVPIFAEVSLGAEVEQIALEVRLKGSEDPPLMRTAPFVAPQFRPAD
ncbi:MAG: cytochrome c oxidase accessory protein CcoG [Myxococcota bacterium]